MAKLPKSIIKKYGITKKAWAVFRGRKGKRKSAKPKTNPKKVRRMVRRRWGRKRRGGGKSMTRTAFKLIRLGALAAPAIARLTKPGTTTEYKMQTIMHDYCGWWQGNWKPERMLNGWGPYLGACLATYGIPKLIGIIRRL